MEILKKTGPVRTSVRPLRQTFVVNLQHGMHARPCALLVKTLRPYQSQVVVEANGEQANGHSIMSLMAMAARHGTPVTFTITGDDAPQAMAAVARLFDSFFEEAYREPARSQALPPQAVETGTGGNRPRF